MTQGELPQGWDVKRLAEVTRIGVPKGWKPTPVDGKIPFIAMADIDELTGLSSRYVLKDLQQVTSGKVRFGADAILAAKITPCVENRKTALVPEIPTNGGFATTEVFAVHPSQKTDRKFLLYFLRSPYARDILVGSMTGTTGRQRVPKDALENLRVPLPPLEEQRRIVARIEELTRPIEEAKRLRQAAREQAEKIMPAALAEVFERAEEEGWETHGIASVCRMKTGTTPPSKQEEYYGGKIPWFCPGDLGEHKLLTHSSRTITQKAIDDKKAKVFERGTVLLVTIGATLGKVGLSPRPVSSNQQITGMRFADSIMPDYAYWWFRSQYHALREVAPAATLPILNQRVLGSLPIRVPVLGVQRQVVDYLDGVQANVEQLRRLQEETQAQLDALIPAVLAKAFRGL